MSIYDTMDEKSDSGATPWIPENAGDMIAGVVTGFQQGTTEYGDFDLAEIAVLDRKGEQTGEERTIAFMGTVLKNAFVKLRANGRLVVGSELAVRFDGMKDGKMNPYKAFTVIAEPPSVAKTMDKTPASGESVQDGLPF